MFNEMLFFHTSFKFSLASDGSGRTQIATPASGCSSQCSASCLFRMILKTCYNDKIKPARLLHSNDKMRDLSATEVYSLSVVSAVCLAILINAWRSDGEPLFAALAISGLGFSFSYALLRWTGDVFMQRGYKGRDMSKKNPTDMYV